MLETAGDARPVLAYLRDMAQYCRDKRRQDLEWYYEQAIAFLSSRIFGELPPQKKIVAPRYAFHQPPNPGLPPGFRPAKLKMPLRAIVQVNPRPHGYETVLWESLSCGHELLAPPGYGNPTKSRRCIYCAFVASQPAAKKPAASVGVSTAKSKAVGA
jgi:hypothetical protein